MHLAFYFHSISRSGGAEKIITNLINYLSENEIKIEIITFDDPESESFYFINKNIVWHKLGYKNKINRFKMTYKILKSKKFNYFVCFNLLDTKSIFFASIFSNTKLILCERNGPSMYFIKYNFYERLKIYIILFFSKKILVQFETYKDKYPWFLRKKISSIPNPITVNETVKYVINKNNYKILYLGRFDNFQKQIDLVIKSYFHLNKYFPSWELILVGDGKDKMKLTNLVNKLKLSHKVKFYNETQDVEKFYLMSDLFIYPSRWEGFPNSLAEALSFGIPSIGLKNAEGVSNLINNENGWLAVNNKDIYNKLKFAMENPKIRLEKSNNAKKIIEEFNSKKIYRKWYYFFLTSLNE